MNGERRKKPTVGSLIGIIVALAMVSPELLGALIVIGLMILPVYLLLRGVKSGKSAPKKTGEVFDDCPKPFCFHRDKGEHHVRKGREIDPWDRPDIDISKYQRR